jgi:uncharacterized membrane protein YfcA
MRVSDWLPLAAAMLATGAVGGVLAGLLGVGGGIVIVPFLEYALAVLGIDAEVRVHIAIATSLATIIPTSISSARAHARRDSVDLELARSWALPLVAGALLGAVVASHVRSAVLTVVFGSVALLVALKMMLPFGDRPVATRVPRGWSGAPVPFAIGTLSALMGIGGGTVSVPVMSLYGQPIHRAVGTAALFGLFISLPGTLAFLAAHPAAATPWGTVGYVSLPGLALIAPAAMLLAPVGARIAHSLSHRALAIVFGLFLGLVAARMLYRSWIDWGLP